MFCKYQTTPLDAKTFVIEEKTPFSQALCYLLRGEASALLIDTGMPFGNMKKTVKELTDLPVTAVNTHAHVDHIGSNFRFDEICFHEDDREMFALHTDPAYIGGELTKYALPPKPAKLLGPIAGKLLCAKTAGHYTHFKDGYIFHLGGRDLEVIQTPGHTPGSVCFLDREARMIFTGDTLCEWGVLLDLRGSCPPETFLSTVRRLKALSSEFDTILPGHHGWPVDKGYIDEFEKCAEGIEDGSAEMITEGSRRFAKFGRIQIAIPPQ